MLQAGWAKTREKYQKIFKAKRAGGMAQVVEHKGLSSNPNTAKRKGVTTSTNLTLSVKHMNF
jgi:hypothetical protein